MKCRECNCCKKGYFESKPEDYVCTGVKEPFVIGNINVECTEYEEYRNRRIAKQDSLIITFDDCPPYFATLYVAREDKHDITILNKFQGDVARRIYDYLSGRVYDNFVAQAIKELKEQEVPPHIRKKIIDALCNCVIENMKYKGILY